MVRNSIFIFCLCVCFCQHHISVSLYTHLYTHIINKLLHGWFVCTIFIIHSLWRIAKLTRSLRSLVRLTILHNSWIKIVRTHQPWSNLYLSYQWFHRSSRISLVSFVWIVSKGMLTWIRCHSGLNPLVKRPHGLFPPEDSYPLPSMWTAVKFTEKLKKFFVD